MERTATLQLTFHGAKPPPRPVAITEHVRRQGDDPGNAHGPVGFIPAQGFSTRPAMGQRASRHNQGIELSSVRPARRSPSRAEVARRVSTNLTRSWSLRRRADAEHLLDTLDQVRLGIDGDVSDGRLGHALPYLGRLPTTYGNCHRRATSTHPWVDA